jgi:hypothetical protein
MIYTHNWLPSTFTLICCRFEIGKILEAAEKARIRWKVQEWFYSPRIVEEQGEKPKVVSFCIAFFHTFSAFQLSLLSKNSKSDLAETDERQSACFAEVRDTSEFLDTTTATTARNQGGLWGVKSIAISVRNGNSLRGLLPFQC